MPAPTAAQNARAILAASAQSIGRFQGPEQLDTRTVDFATPSQFQLTRLNLNRPMESLTVDVRFRMVVSAAAYVNVSPEAPQNILQRIVLNGSHSQFGNITPISLTGASLYACFPGMFQTGGSSQTIVNGVKAAQLGRPIVSPLDNGSGVIATGTYDVIIIYQIPLGLILGTGQSTKRDGASYLYQPYHWGESLNLTMSFGDKSAMGNPTGATVAFTAFGSGAGLPQVTTLANYSILGQFQNQIRTGLVVRAETIPAALTAVGVRQRLAFLSKNVTTNIIVKSGTQTGTGITAGVSTFTTLSDVQLESTRIEVDNKPVRNNTDNVVMKAYLERQFGVLNMPGGYFDLSFIDGQNPQLAYRGDQVPPGSDINLLTDIISASANNKQQYIQEMIYGGPFQPAAR